MSLTKRILIENFKNKSKNLKNNINKKKNDKNDNICYLPFNDIINKEKKFILLTI